MMPYDKKITRENEPDIIKQIPVWKSKIGT